MTIRSWVAGFFGREPDDPPRLIDLPGQVRVPSPGLLRRLRALDARAEVVYLGQGRWWLGRVKPNTPRVHRGRQMLQRMRDGDGMLWNYADWRQAQLMAQGFGLVVDVTVQGEPDALLEAEFRMALYVERGGILETDRAREEQAAKESRRKQVQDRERELARWLFSRSENGRGNPRIGYGGNRPIATQRIGSLG